MTATPNHARQRSATLAFSYRSAALTSTGSVTACAPTMKSLLFSICVLAVPFASFAADTTNEFQMQGRRIPETKPWTYKFTINGVPCSTLDDLKRAITLLPSGSRLSWETGCFLFFDIPVGSEPRMKMKEFQAFCAEHNVTFRVTHNTGW